METGVGVEGDVETACPGRVDPKGARQVYFSGAGGFLECPIYERSRLAARALVRGPAVIEEYDSTTLVHPDFSVAVDAFGNLRLKRDTRG